jgi:tRNA U34 5-methylaminomethyl-2-thiouridine-forming methyltransferase MnmC
MEAGKRRIELVTSEDGSHTLRIPELKEHYHSYKGALRESEHVFIKMGLNTLASRNDIRLLEVGFGTGLNALVTALRKGNRSIHYIGLEPIPLSQEIIEQLNYTQLLADDSATDIYQKLHKAPWQEVTEIMNGFYFQKLEQKLEDYKSKEQVDLIYYDAFAPHAQPELWEAAIWEQLYQMMKPEGILVTYCAKGQVRRDLQSAGFTVERLPGPPGKREMLRAKK